MALTPYIWALWQTKTGKVLIICLLISCVIYILIKTFEWWTIPIVIGFALIMYIGVKLEAKEREKEHQKMQKKLSDESDKLHRIYEEQERMRKRMEKRYLKELQKEQNGNRL